MTITIAISAVALLMSAWTLYRNSLMRASIRVAFGDSVDLVQHSTGPDLPSSIQLACVFTNEGSQTGVIEKLLLVVQPQGAEPRVLDWRIFFGYRDGHQTVPKEKAHAIPTLGKHTHFEGIQFSTADEIEWRVGTCKLELLGWINRNCNEKPNLRQSLSFEVTEQLLQDVAPEDYSLAGPSLHAVTLNGYEVTSQPRSLQP